MKQEDVESIRGRLKDMEDEIDEISLEGMKEDIHDIDYFIRKAFHDAKQLENALDELARYLIDNYGNYVKSDDIKTGDIPMVVRSIMEKIRKHDIAMQKALFLVLKVSGGKVSVPIELAENYPPDGCEVVSNNFRDRVELELREG